MKNDKGEPIGIDEIARELGCSTRTVRRYHAAGKLPTFKVGAKTSPIRMDRADLRRLKKQRGK